MINLAIAIAQHMRPMDLATAYGALIELACTDAALVFLIARGMRQVNR